MALDVTPIYRNLRTMVTFLGLEAEDLFAILAIAVVMNICGRFLNREMFNLPMNMVLQYFVPILSVPALMLFKYGKQVRTPARPVRGIGSFGKRRTASSYA